MRMDRVRQLLVAALLLGLAACAASDNGSSQSPSGGTLSNGVAKGHPGETS